MNVVINKICSSRIISKTVKKSHAKIFLNAFVLLMLVVSMFGIFFELFLNVYLHLLSKLFVLVLIFTLLEFLCNFNDQAEKITVCASKVLLNFGEEYELSVYEVSNLKCKWLPDSDYLATNGANTFVISKIYFDKPNEKSVFGSDLKNGYYLVRKIS